MTLMSVISSKFNKVDPTTEVLLTGRGWGLGDFLSIYISYNNNPFRGFAVRRDRKWPFRDDTTSVNHVRFINGFKHGNERLQNFRCKATKNEETHQWLQKIHMNGYKITSIHGTRGGGMNFPKKLAEPSLSLGGFQARWSQIWNPFFRITFHYWDNKGQVFWGLD